MVKVISLSEPAYRLLKSLKGNGQSFSDVIVEKLEPMQVEKTEDLHDLLDWVKKLPKSGKKQKISTRIDEILYGKKP